MLWLRLAPQMKGLAVIKRDRDPISKALAALKWLVEDDAPDVGVRELASALNVSPSSAHRLLNALVASGFVHQDPATSRYSLGLEFIRISRIAASRITISKIALPHMARLAEKCGETVLLCIYDSERKQMMFVEALDSPHALRYIIELNSWQPVFAGASGQAIMAFLPDDEITEIIDRGVWAVSDQTLTDPAALRKNLETIRSTGYARTRGQRIRGAVGLSAPVFGSGGEVLGAICLTIPDQRFDPAQEQSLAEMVMACARVVSSDIGTGS